MHVPRASSHVSTRALPPGLSRSSPHAALCCATAAIISDTDRGVHSNSHVHRPPFAGGLPVEYGLEGERGDLVRCRARCSRRVEFSTIYLQCQHRRRCVSPWCRRDPVHCHARPRSAQQPRMLRKLVSLQHFRGDTCISTSISLHECL